MKKPITKNDKKSLSKPQLAQVAGGTKKDTRQGPQTKEHILL